MTRTPPADPLAAAYLEHLAVEHTPSNTIRSRNRVLASLEPFGGAGAATRDDIHAWWISRADLSPATRANDLANLRTFYKWCLIWDHRTDDPTVREHAPHIPQTMPRPMSRDDLHKILAHVNDRGEHDLRRAICLGAYSGLRVSEAASLMWPDVDLEARRARIYGKGEKERIVAFSPVLIDQLLPDTGGNVVTSSSEVNSAGVLQRRVNRAIKAAGVKATFHQLRHRYGTIGYQATGDVLALMRQMGHSSPNTTQRYAAASDAAADRIAAAVVR